MLVVVMVVEEKKKKHSLMRRLLFPRRSPLKTHCHTQPFSVRPKRKVKKTGYRLKETLHEIYYDPAQSGSYGGVNQLLRVMKK